MYLNFLSFTGGSRVAERTEQNDTPRQKGNIVAFPKYVVVSDKYKLPMLEQDDNLISRKIPHIRMQNTYGKFECSGVAGPRETDFIRSYTSRWKSGFKLEKEMPCKSSFRYGFGIEHEVHSLRMRLLNTRIGTAPLTRSADDRRRAMNKASENANKTCTTKSRRAMTCVNLKFPASHDPATIIPSPSSTPKYVFQRTVFSAQLSNTNQIRDNSETDFRRRKQKTTKGFTTCNPGLRVSITTQMLLEKPMA